MLKYDLVRIIDLNDWDTLVQETYGKPYSFQQQDGCKERGRVGITIPNILWDWEEEMNDSIPEIINGKEMGVKFDVWLARDPRTPLNATEDQIKKSGYYWGQSDEDLEDYKTDPSHIYMFWGRNFYPHIQSVANDLYEKGLIEAGDYQINIDW